MLLRPFQAARWNRPTSGPYQLNRASPHAANLHAWYPIDFSCGRVIREVVRNSFGMVVQNNDIPTVSTSPFGPMLTSVSGGDGGNSLLDPDFTGIGNANATLACWVNIPDTSRSGVFFKVGGGTSGFAIGIGNTQVNNTGNNLVGLYEFIRYVPSGAAIGTGWHHIAMTVDASGFPALFIDGVSVYSDTSGAPSSPTDGAWVFPKIVNSQPPLGCAVADIRVYNRALTAAQIWALYDPATRWDLYRVPSSRVFFDVAAAVDTTTEWKPYFVMPPEYQRRDVVIY